MIRLLVLSSLYPSSVRPNHGLFVETRLRELLGTGEVEARVVSPLPWFPSTNPRFGEYARFARTPLHEVRNGVEVYHPRYLTLPRIGMYLQPWTLAVAVLHCIRRIMRAGYDFDLIDAHYFYPDGVAAAAVAKALGKPFVVTARGTDVNVISKGRVPGMMVRWAGRRASALIGVSQALVDEMRAQGIGAGQLLALRNGVDLNRFAPEPKSDARARLALEGQPLLLSVGNLVPPKGHDVAIEALSLVRRTHPQARLVIVGEGPDRPRLEGLVSALALAGMVRFAGGVPNVELRHWYSAADALILASEREGWPNVLLEAMACGTPVVATRVSGIPEILGDQSAGLLVDPRTAEAFAVAIGRLIEQRLSPERVRGHAQRFGWQPTTDGQLALFRTMCARS